MTVHDFNERLRFSQMGGDETFWSAVYCKAFPSMVSHMPCPGDTVSQRMGIDRIILLANGRTLAIDEKKREKDYSDILLEYLSNDKTGAKGWIEKDLSIDYLAYAFMPSKRVYLFDWCMLQRAWSYFGNEWKRKYKPVIAKNNGYRTHSIPVPRHELLNAVSRAFIIQLDDGAAT